MLRALLRLARARQRASVTGAFPTSLVRALGAGDQRERQHQDQPAQLTSNPSCWKRGLSSAAQHPKEEDLHDTVKRGYLCGKLDPLRRVERGMWQRDTVDKRDLAVPEGANDLLNLLNGYPWLGGEVEKEFWLSISLKLKSHTKGKEYYVDNLAHESRKLRWKLPDLFEHLADAYSGTLCAQFAHLDTISEIDWLAKKLENRNVHSGGVKRGILHSLLNATLVEQFLAEKFPSSKRFGLEGCESLIPGIEFLVRQCALLGVVRMHIGMAHRGRLNVLCNVLHKPLGAICCEMEGKQSEFSVGDIKYHLGTTGTYAFSRSSQRRIRELSEQEHLSDSHALDDLETIRLSVTPNPSHLEAINPVVLGIVRANQTLLHDRQRKRVMGLLVHGDAAFSSLGAVHECLQLANLEGYDTGGTVHIVVNNQIGFTTVPYSACSSHHSTDPAKVASAPILHVNADDPIAVCEAMHIAAHYRDRFQHDVVINLVGYRRHGHNELDDPSITLPLTYTRIKQHPTVLEIFRDRLLQEKTITQPQYERWQANILADFEQQYKLAESGEFVQQAQEFICQGWQKEALANASDEDVCMQEPTGLPIETLMWAGERITTASFGFNMHEQVKKLYQRRLEMVSSPDSRVDWGMAEALAFGTLVLHRGAGPVLNEVEPSGDSRDLAKKPVMGLNRGHYRVRLIGQDVERGTFNQRHAAVYDQKTGARLVPLNHIIEGGQDEFEVWNSPLMEFGPLGFEYGMSLALQRKALVVWEAQFGDFVNNAQVIIDQFISSGEERWNQKSNLVVLLPHGYDGQGPDHSSARLERFLQLMNDDPDHLPGHDPVSLSVVQHTFDALVDATGGRKGLSRESLVNLLKPIVGPNDQAAARMLWDSLRVTDDKAEVSKEQWETFMTHFLELNAESAANMIVVNCTTPAQYFHVLRRQVNMPFYKPLIIMSPKRLLSHRPCTSPLRDFQTGTHFQRVIDDGLLPEKLDSMDSPASVRKVLLCSGQIYYELERRRQLKKIRDVAIVRVEQIAPFPHQEMNATFNRYPNAQLVWVQEEPKNMGAWNYVKPRADTVIRYDCIPKGVAPRFLSYVGRPCSASTATASFRIHTDELAKILASALH